MVTDLKLDAVDQELGGTKRTDSIGADQSEQSDDANRFALFRDWIHSRWYPKRGKFSFLNGVLEAEMSPESLFDHNLVKSAFGATLYQVGEQDQVGRLYVDRALFINVELGIATEPDLMFCCWSTLREKRVECRRYKKARKGRVELHGTPDVIVEIVSNSSVRKDNVLLKQLYCAAGIPEYWLIDARDGRLEFTIFQRGETEYRASVCDSDGYPISNSFGRGFLLERYADPIGEDAFRLRSKVRAEC